MHGPAWDGADVRETLGAVLALAMDDGVRPLVEMWVEGNWVGHGLCRLRGDVGGQNCWVRECAASTFLFPFLVDPGYSYSPQAMYLLSLHLGKLGGNYLMEMLRNYAGQRTTSHLPLSFWTIMITDDHPLQTPDLYMMPQPITKTYA
jgi:hypothetical protein